MASNLSKFFLQTSLSASPVNLQAIHQSLAYQSFVNGSFVKVFLRQTFALYSITPILEVKSY